MMAAAMDHVVEVHGRVEVSMDAREDLARTTVICGLRPRQKLRIVKYLAYGWSSLRSRPGAARPGRGAALHSARYTGWQGLLDSAARIPRRILGMRRRRGRGRPGISAGGPIRAVPLLQASARAERRAIPGKGLTGTGYDGHAFWDTEGFVLPVLTYTLPHAAADALRWRASTLDLAKERAAELGLAGAAFPWRTIRGQECSAYWPAGTAAWHINADIAMAFERYRIVTGDHSTRGGLRPRGAHRDRPAVDVARTSRPARRLAPRRRHRSRRVHRDRARQRLHQPDGGTQSRHRRRSLCPPSRRGGEPSGSRPRRWPPGAMRPQR